LNDFTNLYELSKTLRFELKPVGKTWKMLKDNKVFEKDEKIARNYEKAKKWFDKLHQEFIDDALSKVNLDKTLLEKFEQAYFAYKKNRTSANRKELADQKTQTRKAIRAQFEITAEEWRDEYVRKITNKKEKDNVKKLKKLDLFFKVQVFGLLKNKYPDAIIDQSSIFDSFNKFASYFSKFHQTRENFYKIDGTATAIPTRIVDENLPKFLENRKAYCEKYQNKRDELFTNTEKKIFELEYFNQCLSQSQIDGYNQVLAGLRSKINKKRQTAEDRKEYPLFIDLFKQILGEKNKQDTGQSDFIEITGDDQVLPVFRQFIKENEEQLPRAKRLFESFVEDQLSDGNDYDISRIYIAGRFLNQISNKWFVQWGTIRSLFLEKGVKTLPDFVSIKELKDKMRSLGTEKGEIFRDKYENIYQNEKDYYKIFIKIWEYEFANTYKDYEVALSQARKLVNSGQEYKNSEKSEQKDIIRAYAETALSLYQMMKYFSLEKGKEQIWNPYALEEDGGFYTHFIDYYQSSHTWQYYNALRNHLTKKPYDTDKVKLNFDDSTLLSGWDKNKEKDCLGVILHKNEKYYLAIMRKEHNTIFSDKFDKQKKEGVDKGYYDKMVYKLIADPKRDFPKGLLSKKGIKEYKPSQEVIDIYTSNAFKADSPHFSLNKLHKLIDYFKECIPKHPSWSMFDFAYVKPTKDYKNNIGEFYNDIAKNSWRVWFERISDKYINEKLENGQLYLFEIHNKDFAPKAEGKKNLHTYYWQEIFSSRNQKEPVVKLNGQAEIFFRRGSLEKKVDNERNAPRDVIKKKRYTEDKIFFHCPLSLNFTKDETRKDTETYKGPADGFSVLTREYLAKNPDINVIGIDRGEKHLAYYSVVDQKGNILDVGSLNKINGTDYQMKLDELEKDRDRARKTWQDIAKIKEMKDGYISQAVKKICDLMLKYNAIVVFEDLNSGFKRGRFAIEKQVYQKLELALAKKLNYLALKERNADEAGGYRTAYQLTPEITNFKDIHRQCGFIFYIPASYTSSICPVCGFRKNIQTPIATKEKNKEFLEKISIVYEKDKDRFKFNYKKTDHAGKHKKIKKSGYKLFDHLHPKNEFAFYSDVERLQFKRSKDNRTGEVKWRYPNDELKKLFKGNGIDITRDINDQIKEKDLDNNTFYKPLIHTLRLILQLRNSGRLRTVTTGATAPESHDFIQCPACYFHSDNNYKELQKKYKNEDELVFNGDANGAYNIARKGSLALQKITDLNKTYSDVSKIKNEDLVISQEEWDKFAQVH